MDWALVPLRQRCLGWIPRACPGSSFTSLSCRAWDDSPGGYSETHDGIVVIFCRLSFLSSTTGSSPLRKRGDRVESRAASSRASLLVLVTFRRQDVMRGNSVMSTPSPSPTTVTRPVPPSGVPRSRGRARHVTGPRGGSGGSPSGSSSAAI